jgi:zinc transporter 1
VNVKQSTSRERSDSAPSLYGHPAATRASLVQAANDMASSQARSPSPTRHYNGRRSTSRSGIDGVLSPAAEETRFNLPDVLDEDESEEAPTPRHAHESTPLLNQHNEGTATSHDSSSTHVDHARGNGHAHGHGSGHNHGSMNMHAVLLHVLGDALGNVGVIATGLIIWLTEWRFKYYCDPVISLVITVIIFSSALPLGKCPILRRHSRLLTPPVVRSASYILLQGVPNSISLDEVRSEILAVKGILSVHELHVWQLSESKVVASVHVTTSRNVDFMDAAAQIRERLHHLGIHSSTIQPEYHQTNAPSDQALKVSRLRYEPWGIASLPLCRQTRTLIVSFLALRTRAAMPRMLAAVSDLPLVRKETN